MKSFKDYIIEMEPIKLRGNAGVSRKSDDFLDDLHDTTDEHPFSHQERIFNGNSTVHVSRDGANEVHLHDIRSLEPGAGSAALEHLKSLADKHGVRINGIAKAYTKSSKYPMNNKQLAGWYKKRGFNIGDGDSHEGYDVSYEPKTK